MAEVTKKADGPRICSLHPNQDNLWSENVAGEAIGYGDACYVGTDNKIHKCIAGDGTAMSSRVFGFSASKYGVNKSVTLYLRVRFGYMEESSPQVGPGNLLYLSGTVAGGLATTPAYAGAKPVAYVLQEGRIQTMPDAGR